VENAELVVVVVPSADTDRAVSALREYLRSNDTPAALLLGQGESGWDVRWVGMQMGAEVTSAEEVANFFGKTLERVVVKDKKVRTSAHPLVIDERIRRMLRLSVRSSKSVMLVGPPGTGKTQLVGELIEEIGKEPESFGMGLVHNPLIVTPDESWTTRDLVGGETVDNEGRLRFSPGHVLEAIAEDQWLVLDEANRADLDRIFGGLLTWLSGKEVMVGRVSPDPRSSPIILTWGTKPESVVVGEERLRADSSSNEPIYYVAGTDWRLIGTYNAVDAQRVFRFGQALGRRFSHVPVSAPAGDEFSTALRTRIAGASVSEPQADRLRGILERIYATQVEVLDPMGPAALLDVSDYVAAGLLADSASDLAQLVAEGYLACMGSWLSGYDGSRLGRLGVVLGSAEVLGEQWDWLLDHLKALR
jgi:MoxR-like ATPase